MLPPVDHPSYLQHLIAEWERYCSVIRNPRFRDFIRSALEKAHAGDPHDLIMAANYRRFPVDVEEFICGNDYLHSRETIWPVVMEALIELNSGKYVEAVLTGGIGVAKTTIGLYTTAYQLYVLSCLRNPHQLYNLDPTSEIEFIFQSMNASLAKAVDYTRFKNIVERCPYFEREFRYDRNILSELRFPNNILVKPVSGSSMAAIGQNVIGGVIDEMNFMAVVESSKQSIDKQTFDQAVSIYDNISRRRKSRFMKQGKLPGILCLVSSKHYPGQFTDRKIEEAYREKEYLGYTTIYIYDKTTWDVKPEGTFTGEKFWVYTGSETAKPRILEEGEEAKFTEAQLVHVPVEYRSDFERDIMGALRDIASVSTIARYPFILSPEIIADSMAENIPSIFSREECNFEDLGLEFFPQRFKDPKIPRACHIDLAVTGDSAGLAIGTCTGFVTMDRGDTEMKERLPQFRFDGVLEIQPPKGGEILFYKIRNLLYALREKGLNIQWVTFDSYQSTDSMQLLRSKGFSVGYCSTDTSTDPYDFTKAAFADKRITMPYHPKTLREFAALEKDVKRGKIDHPPYGSKDCSDAVAGVVYTLSNLRFIWGLYKVPLLEVPSSIRKTMQKDDINEQS